MSKKVREKKNDYMIEKEDEHDGLLTELKSKRIRCNRTRECARRLKARIQNEYRECLKAEVGDSI